MMASTIQVCQDSDARLYRGVVPASVRLDRGLASALVWPGFPIHNQDPTNLRYRTGPSA